MGFFNIVVQDMNVCANYNLLWTAFAMDGVWQIVDLVGCFSLHVHVQLMHDAGCRDFFSLFLAASTGCLIYY